MNITQKLVRDVIMSNNEKLHPASWHQFQKNDAVIAINFALMSMGKPSKYGSSLPDIVDLAKKYYEDNSK